MTKSDLDDAKWFFSHFASPNPDCVTKPTLRHFWPKVPWVTKSALSDAKCMLSLPQLENTCDHMFSRYIAHVLLERILSQIVGASLFCNWSFCDVSWCRLQIVVVLHLIFCKYWWPNLDPMTQTGLGDQKYFLRRQTQIASPNPLLVDTTRSDLDDVKWNSLYK